MNPCDQSRSPASPTGPAAGGEGAGHGRQGAIAATGRFLWWFALQLQSPAQGHSWNIEVAALLSGAGRPWGQRRNRAKLQAHADHGPQVPKAHRKTFMSTRKNCPSTPRRAEALRRPEALSSTFFAFDTAQARWMGWTFRA